jgi:hypothetical protein
MVDALASGASEHYARGGSTPLVRTKPKDYYQKSSHILRYSVEYN